ncbi:MAG: FAD/NAD(P)-binding protein [Planctomycetota bacterium]|nr:FAD/NAD(P)-binding protein [Planctomycetota bacterium]
MSNGFVPVPAVIDEIIVETPTIKTFVLKPAEPIPFRAGQFVQLEVPGLGEAPFTPSSSPFETDTMEITILKTGLVTNRLHELEAGERLGIRGPFGKGYPIPKLDGQTVLVIGGGVGLAPLRSLLYHLFGEPDCCDRVTIKYGARNPAEMCFKRQHEGWSARQGVDFTPTIDRPAEGWDGHVGLVTTLLDDLDLDRSKTYAVSCGPEVMLRFVTWKLLDVGFPPDRIYLSMNRNMSCGMGICGRCNVGPYYLCKDGPDMCYADIQDIPYALG